MSGRWPTGPIAVDDVPAVRCSGSTDGEHLVAHAAARVCYVDDRSIDVDIDTDCELCGACLISAALEDINWTFDTDEEPG